MRTLLIWTRSLIFFVVFCLAVVTWSIVCLLVFPFLPLRKRFRFGILINHFIVWWFAVSCGVRYEIIGRENLPKHDSGVLISNHQSEWETFFLQVLVFPLCTVLKKELLRIPFFGWALAMVKPIAIDRTKKANALKQVAEQGSAKLAQRFWVLIFPEGTRMGAGELGKYSKTGALLAAKTGKPLVPVLHNAGDCWPKNGFIKRPGTLRVLIGPAIEAEGKSAAEMHDASIQWIEANRDRVFKS
ncbi:MAG: lysophospholipid acyltransferase family protein [Pseudomonadales bacterium]|jgi:1-acyl-sn-glycerol-3-phosphate acyltransferase